MNPTPHNIATYTSPTVSYALDNEDETEAYAEASFVVETPMSDMAPICWTIDGGEVGGSRFYAIPNFARGKPPLRIDTYIPDFSNQTVSVRTILDTNSGIFLENRQVGSSKISQHLIRALGYWSNNIPDFEDSFVRMPFGSRILIENLDFDHKKMSIHMIPDFSAEQSLLSLNVLLKMWNLTAEDCPKILDLESLSYESQLHDTISLVKIRKNGIDPDHFHIFKSQIKDFQYLYHELKILLLKKPHPNVIPRPQYIIVKRGRFGGKVGVCGFLLEYHPNGPIRRAMEAQIYSGRTQFRERLRWATQITEALQHFQADVPGFYTNLKLDNIVVSLPDNKSLNAVIIDFEQRLGSPAWSPPEIHYIMYLKHMATQNSDLAMKDYYTKLLKEFRPDFTIPSRHYKNPEHGYSEPWWWFSVEERESAQVYMLGKLLWSLFEGATVLNNYISINTFRERCCDTYFPEFKQTPETLQRLIKACTAGAKEWEGRFPPYVRKGNKIYPRNWAGDDDKAASEEVKRVSRAWWKEEMQTAEEFIRIKIQKDPNDKYLKISKSRPKLTDVLNILIGLKEY